MKHNIFTLNWLNKILFCTTFILKFFTDVLWVAQGKGGIVVSAKYGTLILGIIFSFFIIHLKIDNGRRIVFTKETFYITQVVILFLVISTIKIIIRNKMTDQTLIDISYIILAILYAFCILNTLSFYEIHQCMKILLIFAIIGYIIEIGSGNFTLSNLQLISFSDSSSPFESSYSASISMILCTYFAYFRQEKKWTIISFFFCLATFKRMNIIFAVFFLIYPILFNPNRKINKKLIFILKLFFIFATIAIFYLYQAKNAYLFESIFNVDATKFSTGRNLYLQKLLLGGFSSYGYGSSTDFLGYSLEMDFVKIYVELGIIGLTFFIWRYYDIAGCNAFCFWIMTENMLNFLTSHSLASAFNWGLRFILIGCILYKYPTENKIIK